METEPFFLDPDYADAFADDGSFDREQLKEETLGDYHAGCMVLFFYFFPVVAFFGGQLFPYLSNAHVDDEFERNGALVDFVIWHCAMEEVEDNGDHPRIYYSYTVDDQIYSYDQVLTRKYSCDPFPDDTVIQGEYLPDDPATSRIVQNSRNMRESERAESIRIMVYAGGAFFYVFVLMTVLSGAQKNRQRYKRLIANGLILDGEIVEATGVLLPRDRTRPKEEYQVTVEYTFPAPYKRFITTRQHKIRDDLRDKELPRKGTPVKVLYADDDAFVML